VQNGGNLEKKLAKVAGPRIYNGQQLTCLSSQKEDKEKEADPEGTGELPLKTT